MATRAGAAEMAKNDEENRIAAKRWRFVPLLLVLAGLGFGYAMGWQRYLTLDFLAESRLALKAFVSANPVAAPLGFTLLYAIAVAFSFPAASVLTIFSGFLFGWLFGGVLAIIGATTGATVLFLAARTAFGDFLKERAGGTVARLSQGFERDAFSYLLVLRIAPFIPFFVVNIAPAVFNVRLRTFLAATLIGILPGAFAYAWLGQGVDSVLVAARKAGREVAIGDLVTPEITIAFAALALVAALAAVVRKFWLRAA
jgi:uncharacterized membrane protein YdjX (TVP38/TMEM64 family)